MDTLYGFARFSERLVGTGIKLVRDFQQDPRAATLTGIGKVAEIVCELLVSITNRSWLPR